MCEIPVTDVGHVLIGQNENVEAATGCLRDIDINPESLQYKLFKQRIDV